MRETASLVKGFRRADLNPVDHDGKAGRHVGQAPPLIAGGANMGLKHGNYWKENDETRMSNVHLSILRTLGVEQESFSDSTSTLSDSVFTKA